MNKSFDVLNPELDIHRHYLLEASAGTGKTFSIQHLFTRLIIETSHPLNQILVVTFTRAAVRELRSRIRRNLEMTLETLTQSLLDGHPSHEVPDYVLAIIESGADKVKQAKNRLQQALFSFEQAQIFTIHSFCSRMLRQYTLESDIGVQANLNDQKFPLSSIKKVMRDFFRTELHPTFYSTGQLSLVMKKDPDQNKLLKAIQRGFPFTETQPFSQLLSQFQFEMRALKRDLGIKSEWLIEDFKQQQPHYYNHKSVKSKAEALEKASRFAALFEKETWNHDDFDLLIEEDLIWTKALDPSLLKKAPTFSLHYPAFTQTVKLKLAPLVQEARSFPHLLARLGADWQPFLSHYMHQEEVLSPDTILRSMEEALQKPDFSQMVRRDYQAAIIDEFQDTDPIQWSIFRNLFASDAGWDGHLYLVGDPKQSIYSFRQADIYTYLDAAHTLGKDSCYSLDTNYRSQPSLVKALNILFNSCSRLIPLPKNDDYISYSSVQSSQHTSEHVFQDDRGVVHFIIADGREKKMNLMEMEENVFFPFIANEILSLRNREEIDYPKIAILVRDRHQENRLTTYLAAQHIPYANQRGSNLADSECLTPLIDLIRAVLHPNHHGTLKTALGGPILGFTHKEFSSSLQLDICILKMRKLNHTLMNEGFASFFAELLQSQWLDDGLCVGERILSREHGVPFYRDLQQIVDLIIDHKDIEWHTPEGIISFLDGFKIWNIDEDERLKRSEDPSNEGVKILTLHVSKGLEFDIVFALGLVNRTPSQDELIPIERDGKHYLTPYQEENPAIQRYFEEIDAEKMRQLYVAMTRAKYRLYVPAAIALAPISPCPPEASPMELFLAKLEKPHASLKEIYSRIETFDGSSLQQFIKEHGEINQITYSIDKLIDRTADSHDTKIAESNELVQPKQSIAIPGIACMMTSFSTLTRGLKEQCVNAEFSPPRQYDIDDKTIHTLPANSMTGLLLHAILEKIPFCEIRSQGDNFIRSFIKPYIHQTPFQEWGAVLTKLIKNALTTPLKSHDELFCLSEISSQQMYREIPFLFPYQGPIELEGIEMSDGYIKGVIDLLFMHNGKYYIVDWKSNWLGADSSSYQQPFLAMAMAENHYHLQAQLYTQALERYLRIVEKRPFDECFGGVFYLFLRGLDPDEATGNGIFKVG